MGENVRGFGQMGEVVHAMAKWGSWSNRQWPNRGVGPNVNSQMGENVHGIGQMGENVYGFGQIGDWSGPGS